ncbi:unnamed protein product [Blepharisma stoltei]|uniref:Uncharacterized protein n=1 Tax=Blepharisma stoltei TaxID=1481888 RepID=A0AAU9J6C1_9CILI|nr:unnamed protein product [Blepharisma stoltei]
MMRATLESNRRIWKRDEVENNAEYQKSHLNSFYESFKDSVRRNCEMFEVMFKKRMPKIYGVAATASRICEVVWNVWWYAMVCWAELGSYVVWFEVFVLWFGIADEKLREMLHQQL